MRYFEKISKKQFNKDIINGNYDDVMLPYRSTSLSAGYDFYLINDVEILPHSRVKIPTGIKVKLNDDEYLAIYIRSSIGTKYMVRMCNQVGIIDADYYNNIDNEGHIFVVLENMSDEKIVFKKGDKYVQGIFMKYLLTDDDNVETERKGGFGSTD